MEFKSIDSLSITECCELLNLDRIDLPTAVQNLATPSKIEQRLILLIDADRSAFQRCTTINDFDNYLCTWPDGFWRDEANKTKMQLLHIKDDDDFFKLHGSTKSGCKKYLSKFPNGKHKMEAEQLIKTIKKRTRWFLFILFALLALLLYLSYSPARYYVSNSDRRFHLITSCYADSRQTKNVSKLGGSISIVTLSSKNEKWDYTSTNAWAEAIKYDGKIVLKIDKNEAGKRSAIVKIKIYDTLLWGAIATSNYETITVEIVQESGLATYFNIDKDELSLPKEGHADGRCRVVNVNTDGTFWEVVSAPSWCRKVYANIEDKHLEVSVNENTGKTKTGRIVLKSNSGITREIDVVQKGYATYLDVFDDEISISPNGGYRTISVDSDGDWEITNYYSSWVHTSAGENSISLNIDENLGEPRTAYVIVKSGSMEERIDISQSTSLATYLRVESTEINASSSGTKSDECYAVKIYTDGDDVIAETSANWIDLKIIRNDRLEIKVDKNTGSRRNATITIKADKYSKQIRLSQGGFSNCSYCYNWQLGYSTGQVWGITGYTYMWNSQIPQYGWVMCPYCKGTGSIAN